MSVNKVINFRVVATVNGMIFESTDVTEAMWGKNTKDIVVSVVNEMNSRLIKNNIFSFNIEVLEI